MSTKRQDAIPHVLHYHLQKPVCRAFCTGDGITDELGTGWGIHLFGLLRFITGMGGIGSFVVAFVLLVEHVGRKVSYLES